jgi:hypothetical protein
MFKELFFSWQATPAMKKSKLKLLFNSFFKIFSSEKTLIII